MPAQATSHVQGRGPVGTGEGEPLFRPQSQAVCLNANRGEVGIRGRMSQTRADGQRGSWAGFGQTQPCLWGGKKTWTGHPSGVGLGATSGCTCISATGGRGSGPPAGTAALEKV